MPNVFAGINLFKIINVVTRNTNRNEEVVRLVVLPKPPIDSLPHASVCGFLNLSNVSRPFRMSSISSKAIPRHAADYKATFAPCTRDGHTACAESPTNTTCLLGMDKLEQNIVVPPGAAF